MSQLSEKIRRALFARLNTAAVVGDGLATGVYHLTAPETADLPFVLFQRFTVAPVVRAFGQTLIAEDDTWLVKALSDEDSSQTKEPEELNEDILAAAETAIGRDLTIADGETWLVERVRDVPAYTELAADRNIYHNGFLLRVVANG